MATQPQGGLGAMAAPRTAPQSDQPPSQASNPAQAAQRISGLEQAPAEEDFMMRVARNLREQKEALDAQREKLTKSVEARMFDPALMAAATGFLKPTKTGGFGESLGYAAEGYAAQTEKDIANKQASDKASMEMLQQQQKMQNQNLLFENDLRMAGYGPDEITKLTTGASQGATPVSSTPTGGLPAVGSPPRQQRQITEQDIQITSRLDPERGKQLMDLAKLQRDNFMSTPQGVIDKRTGKFVDTGLETSMETSIPYLGVEKITQGQLAEIRALAKQFPVENLQRADQFARYYAANGIGGATYTPAVEGKPAVPSAVPSAGGFSSPSVGGMKTASQRESERRMAEEAEKARIAILQAAETETNKARITKGEDRASLLIDRGQAADTTKQIALDMSAWSNSNPRVFQLMQTATLKDAILRSAEKMGAPLNIDPRIILQYKLTNNDIEAMQMFAQKSAQLTVELRKSSRAPGEGATTESEGRLYSQVEALPTDTARVIGLKSELLALRTDYDKAAATLWVDWRDANPGKSFDKFRLGSDEFKTLRKSYDSTLEAVRKANTDLLSSKAPAATPAAPASSPAPSARGDERVIGGNIWERQPDGSWKDSGRKAK